MKIPLQEAPGGFTARPQVDARLIILMLVRILVHTKHRVLPL